MEPCMLDRSQRPHTEGTEDHGGARRPGEVSWEPKQRLSAPRQANVKSTSTPPKTRCGIPLLPHWPLGRWPNASVCHRGPRCPPCEALADGPARTGQAGEMRVSTTNAISAKISRPRRPVRLGPAPMVFRVGLSKTPCGPSRAKPAVLMMARSRHTQAHPARSILHRLCATRSSARPSAGSTTMSCWRFTGRSWCFPGWHD